MCRRKWHRGIPRRVLSAVALGVAVAGSANAQANIPIFRGDVGLLAGTQAPAGAYAGVFYDYYNAGRVLDRAAVVDPITTNINTLALSLQYSSNWKILGARWAALAVVPTTSLALDVVNLEMTSHWGVGDAYVMPLQLGWTLKQADLLFGQAVFAPSGRFDINSSNNTGLGVWSWESSFGATVYKDTSRKLHFSTLASYQVNSTKRGTDRRPGNVLTLEGGVGQRVRKINGRAGAVYYASWKVTDDRNFFHVEEFDARDRRFGIGPEVTGGFLVKPVFINLTLRYYRELWSRVAPQGGSLFANVTAYLPAKAPKPNGTVASP
jgi:hypothetical protein